MLKRSAFFTAALGAALIVLVTLIAPLGFPDYSHRAQFISELGASGAPNEMLIRFVGFLPPGILLCFFTFAAFQSLPKSDATLFGFSGIFMYALAYVVAAFFPCDLGCRPEEPSSSQIIHNSLGIIGYMLAPASLFFLGKNARHWPDARGLMVTGYGGAVVTLVGLLTLSPDSPFVGISQRLIEAAMLIWILMCAAYIRRDEFQQDSDVSADS